LNAAQIAVGSELPPRSFGPLTMTDVVAYQGASGDLNPMHHDDDLARSAGYPAAFSVGMLGAGYLATLCTDHFGTDSVRRFSTRFRRVVHRGETLTAHGRIVRVVDIDGESRAVIELRLVSATGETVTDGEADFALSV
jgi:acyl dehydratase